MKDVHFELKSRYCKHMQAEIGGICQRVSKKWSPLCKQVHKLKGGKSKCIPNWDSRHWLCASVACWWRPNIYWKVPDIFVICIFTLYYMLIKLIIRVWAQQDGQNSYQVRYIRYISVRARAARRDGAMRHFLVPELADWHMHDPLHARQICACGDSPPLRVMMN